jgi:uncharacterized phage-associated protein
MKRITASEVAATILTECWRRKICVSNLKLQKLLYYCEAWWLAFYGKSLFNEPIEAWVHGPVVPCVFREYKDYKWSSIGAAKAPASTDKEVLEHVNAVLDAYGDFEASALTRLTHGERPWMEARSGLEPDMPSNRAISRATMTKYFASKIEQKAN